MDVCVRLASSVSRSAVIAAASVVHVNRARRRVIYNRPAWWRPARPPVSRRSTSRPFDVRSSFETLMG